MTRVLSSAAAVIFAVVALAACGGGADDGSSECADVWVEGRALPDGYDGCESEGDSMLGLVYEHCTIWVDPDETMFATTGEVETPVTVKTDQAYAKIGQECASGGRTSDDAGDASASLEESVKARIDADGPAWAGSVSAVSEYSPRQVVISTDLTAKSDARTLCEDVSGWAGSDGIPDGLQVFVEDTDGADLAQC